MIRFLDSLVAYIPLEPSCSFEMTVEAVPGAEDDTRMR